MTLHSLLKVNWHFRGTICPNLQAQIVSWARSVWKQVASRAYSLTLKISGMFFRNIDFQQATWHYVPEDRNLQAVFMFMIHVCETIPNSLYIIFILCPLKNITLGIWPLLTRWAFHPHPG
jgi:hypothetical protein